MLVGIRLMGVIVQPFLFSVVAIAASMPDVVPVTMMTFITRVLVPRRPL